MNDLLLYAFKNLKRQKTRALLATFGILLSSLLLFFILTLSESFLSALSSELEAFGEDIIIVLPYSGVEQAVGGLVAGRLPAKGRLDDRDVEEVEGVEGVVSVGRIYSLRLSVSFRDAVFISPVYGMDEVVFYQYPHIEFAKGRPIRVRGEVVLGGEVAERLEADINHKLLIGGRPFRVVGVLKKIGSSISETDDNSIIISVDDAKELGAEDIAFLSIKAERPEETARAIEERLANLHRVRIDDKDFSVITSKEIIQRINSVFNVARVGITFISLIALLVGSASIANTMMAVVEERKRELGIMRAVGASKAFVMKVVLLEGGLIGLLGGLLGMALAFIFLFIVSNFMEVVFNPLNIFLTLGSAFSIALLASYLPAKRAAELDVVECIRR